MMLLKDERERKRKQDFEDKQRKMLAARGVKDRVVYDLEMKG